MDKAPHLHDFKGCGSGSASSIVTLRARASALSCCNRTAETALSLMNGELSQLQTEKEMATKERDELAVRLQHALSQIKEKDAELEALKRQHASPTVVVPSSVPTTSTTTCDSVKPSSDCNFSVPDALWKMQQWLFGDGGGTAKEVRPMMTEYCVRLRKLGLPMDRLFIGDLVVDPQMSCYIWLWESGKDFVQVEMPRAVYDENLKNLSPNEPFTLLMEGRADRVTMKSSDDDSTISCNWFRDEHYHDYLSLPIRHRGDFRGAVSWATKSPAGFSPQHVEFLEQSLAALSLVIRLQTNEANLQSVMTRLEEEVADRTAALATANKNLAAANRRVQLQSQAQLKHFAMMSHEIRTPLNCIIGLSGLLLDSSLTSSQEESIRMITTSGDLLLRVVDDVLDYSRLVSGKVDFRIEPTDLLQTMETVSKAVGTKAASSKLELRTHYSPDLPAHILTDGRRLQQVLYNLLGNALKFGKDGKFVDFSVSVRSLPPNLPREESFKIVENQQLLRFVVKDFGQGIAQKDIGNIFQPFQQAADSERLYGGTGLGLAITSNLVKGLGGTIAVTSEPGSWCEFVVELTLCVVKEASPIVACRGNNKNQQPLAITEGGCCQMQDVSNAVTVNGKRSLDVFSNPMVEPCCANIACCSNKCDTTDDEPFDFSTLRVLIAEDNVINQKVCSRSLSRLGIEQVDIVGNGREAVDISAKRSYDVIFMDLQMPVMGGLEATRVIVDRRKGSFTPRVIILTAHALKEIQSEAEKAGGDGFISKPFKLKEVEKMLRSMFSSSTNVKKQKVITYT